MIATILEDNVDVVFEMIAFGINFTKCSTNKGSITSIKECTTADEVENIKLSKA